VREPVFNEYFLAGDYARPLQFTTIANSSQCLRIEVTYFGRGERLLFVRDVSESVRMEQIRRDFVANVSHELRTPLTVITGYLENFKDNENLLPPPFTKPLAQMAQQAQRMESLLKDLLWLSRIESEKREAKRELIDVGAIAQEIGEDVMGAYPECKLELDVASSLKVLGDYQELYSAVSNLVTNAIKYAGDAGAVTVRWTRQGEHAILSVEDNGPGIDEVHIPRLTERFYRIDNSRSTQTGGTGLGLAIVKHVAQAHDATLEIKSELGRGAVFSLVFPLGG
jgi:two-component system phosphate regulon sensor histidine kinase PhoR